MAIAFRLAVPVTCSSHTLTATVFSSLPASESFLHISDVRDHSFFLRAENKEEHIQTAQDFVQFGHVALSNFLVALNVGSLGFFTWSHHPKVVFPQYSVVDPAHVPLSPYAFAVAHELDYPPDSIKPFTEEHLFRSTALFSALARETSHQVRHEYLKGLFHYGFRAMDLDFRREAFANFYRSLEYFVTTRVLRTGKLAKELKQMQAVLRELGMDEEVVSEFKRLYTLRSEQVMHAQKEQRVIGWEDVLKLKSLVDLVMHKVYEPIWQANLEALKKHPIP